AGERVEADAGLVDALSAAAGPAARRGPVASTDLFYDHGASRARAWKSAGALAVEMEAATILRIGQLRGIPTACLLAVTDVFGPGGERHRIDEDGLLAAGEVLGRVGAAALVG
ncbi:MAG: hypothetical protein ACRDKY_06060, partial [Solirubrobacteraceae bacterium]